MRDGRDKIEKEIAVDANMQRRISEMEKFIKTYYPLTEYGEVMVRRLIEKVMFFEKNIVVEFKRGISVAAEIWGIVKNRKRSFA